MNRATVATVKQYPKEAGIMAAEPRLQCAENVMETLHMMMRSVGREARKGSAEDVGMHQFRVLMTIKHHEGASLSQISEHLGATISAASKLVDGLVDRGFVQRETDLGDRRRLMLALSEAGEEVVNSAKLKVHSLLAQKLETLTPGECAVLNLAMDLLRSAIVSAPGRQSNQQSEKPL